MLIQPLGSLLYVMFSEKKLTHREVRHMIKLRNVMPGSDKKVDKFSESDGDTALALGKAKAILYDDPQAELFSDTDSEYFALGEQMYEKMLADLKQAQNFIFLEYFIVEEGVMWNQMLEILKERAAAGVEVRMLYDDIGCMATLDGKYDRRLRESGIQCYKFNPFRPDASEMHNNRDHRKLLIVDGQIGYTGGINLADEYINRIQKYGHWKDGGIRLEGAAVKGMTRLFLINWDTCRESLSDYERYLRPPKLPERGEGYYIPFGSGPKPAYFNPVGKNVFLNLINQAKSSLYITTPYLIIDYDLTNAIQNAAKRGVDVRIITPYIPDKKIIQLMTRNSYPPLLESGVKIYEYTPGFIHAKNVIVDDEYAVVGTINFDYRSLVHHYENAVWMYRTAVIPEMKNDFLNTMEKSMKLEQSAIRMSAAQKVLKYCIRLFVPLM
ncbi:MAG: cardiolipin synthase [Frisingicoccus sp.]|uniref:cardiolipin synthase n=2 Tax=Frisingicoccus sp. TaxID=1918627 RepID=UPI00399A4371